VTPPARPLLSGAQDPRVERLPCSHSGTYADDCICQRVQQHRCYIVATCDRDLRRRIRKVRPFQGRGRHVGRVCWHTRASP
jgi:U3 small nucleolar RNA-associated protein 24